MKIKQITNDCILFDNGNEITYGHEQDCCESNYAYFLSLTEDDVNYNYDFDENLEFEAIKNSGFRFGSDGVYIFVPCYSEQNGYYSCDVDIYYNGVKVLCFDAEFIEY